MCGKSYGFVPELVTVGPHICKAVYLGMGQYWYQSGMAYRFTDSVWEGARHGDYGSFRFQMSHKKMPDGDCPITYLPLGDISMYNECPSTSGLIENFANET